MPLQSFEEMAQRYRAAKLNHPGLRIEYAIMMCIAAAECEAVGADTMTVIEFGVYRGDGLLALADICRQITDHCGIKFRLYGFDSGTGLPAPTDYRDHPEIWRAGDFRDVDYDGLKSALPDFAELKIGVFTETIPQFFSSLTVNAPVGFVSIDSDLYSSATAALRLLERPPEYFLPAVLTYFDDVDDILTFNGRSGEALAITEFNTRNRARVIERRRSSLHGYYVCHILDHAVRRGQGLHSSFDIRISHF
jgi:hypothetical protein